MTQHIGIVANSAPGAALCYSIICTEASQRLGAHAHPEISMHAFSFAEHVRRMEAGDWSGVGQLLLRSAEKLAGVGADFVICPDNTAHQALDLILDHSPIPWLHIATVVAEEARRLGYARVGILGTRYLMGGPVYRERLAAAGIAWRLPGPRARERLNDIIFQDLAYGRTPAETRREVTAMIEGLRVDESCDAVILGCTELPLLITPDESPLPTLDSTRLLARAAIERAVADHH